MMKLFLIAQAFHEASGSVGAPVIRLPATDQEKSDLRGLMEDNTPARVDKRTSPRALFKPLQFVYVLSLLIPIGLSIPSVSMIATGTKTADDTTPADTIKNKYLLYSASALGGFGNFSTLMVFIYSFFKGSAKFPLAIAAFVSKVFILWLSFIVHTVGTGLGIAFLATQDFATFLTTTGGKMALASIIASSVVFILNLAYLGFYHMVGPGLFSVIYTSKYGFVTSPGGNSMPAVLAAVAAHTAGQYGLGLGSKSVLNALSMAMKVVAESSELSNWFATLAKYMLTQIADQKKHKSEDGQEKEGEVEVEHLLHVNVNGR